MRQRPTLPGRLQPSTIGAQGLNFCVRYGNRWIPFAIATGSPAGLGASRSAHPENCTPEFRVREAWYDGLDVLAVTDHVEYRRFEGKMLNFLKGYVPEGTEPINYNLIRKAGDERGIQSDLNVPVKLAQETAVKYGITVIPGAEITREPVAYGHYNALFTKDNNAIYAEDALQSLRNAKAQGALVMHNHPGWERKSLDHPEFEIAAYGEGLIDGIEIMNGGEFYPKAIARAHDKNLFVSANTDIHDTTVEVYRMQGFRRNMTLIFARENTLESLREAIEAHRTLAYSFGTIAGDEQLLKDLFTASVKAKVLHTDAKGRRTVALTNNSSVQYILRLPGQNPFILKPFSTVTTTVAKGKALSMSVENMWYSEKDHPQIEIGL